MLDTLKLLTIDVDIGRGEGSRHVVSAGHVNHLGT